MYRAADINNDPFGIKLFRVHALMFYMLKHILYLLPFMRCTIYKRSSC